MTQIVIRRRVPRKRSWLLLACLALVATTAWALPAPATSAEDAVWRRTRDGWEQLDCRGFGQRSREAVFHPLCMALVEVLLVAMAMVAGSSWGFPRPPLRSTTARLGLRHEEDGLPRPCFLRLDSLGMTVRRDSDVHSS